MTHYILAGEIACSHFWNKRWKALEKSINTNNEGRIYTFDYSKPNALSKLIDNVHGWNNFFELSKEDLQQIALKTNIKIPKTKDYSFPVYWSTRDFEKQAEHNFKFLKENHADKFKHLENWSQLYDKSKFVEQLEKMIKNHDCNDGITWLTVDQYLSNCEIK